VVRAKDLPTLPRSLEIRLEAGSDPSIGRLLVPDWPALLELFANNLLPVFLAAAAGYALAWRLRVDPRPVAQLAFFIFAPCLVFQIILDSELAGEALLRMVGFTAASQLLPAALAALAAQLLGWSRPLTAAVVLVVMLPNAGNFGLSANLFAFGDAGLALASVYFVGAAVVTFTVGIFVASLGRSGLRETLIGMLRVPAIWSVLLALVLVQSGWRLPLPLARTVELLSQASIPVFLVVLGMQLHGRGIGGPWGPLALAAGARLLGGAAIALALVSLLGLEGVARQVGVLQAGMPSAVITIVLATEYDVEPAFVTSVVIATTLLSPLTLTPLLAYLGA
jgi:predicted permease